jgi:hypothetical protein
MSTVLGIYASNLSWICCSILFSCIMMQWHGDFVPGAKAEEPEHHSEAAATV